jgi:hypothetical protein
MTLDEGTLGTTRDEGTLGATRNAGTSNLFLLNSEASCPLKKNWRSEQTADRLAGHYREIEIKAVAAAVKSGSKKEASQEEESPSSANSTKQNKIKSKRRESH